jgi:phenylacetate-coenzyme A ligase PaaK-like adenylate-forming protein
MPESIKNQILGNGFKWVASAWAPGGASLGPFNLDKLQWLSQDELEERAVLRLRVLLKHACENVPYYRDLLESADVTPSSINSIADLASIPITGRQAITKNYPHRLVAKNLPRSRGIDRFTSGSTGTPMPFGIDSHEWLAWGLGFSLYLNWAGVDWFDSMIRIAVPTQFYRQEKASFKSRLLNLVRTERHVEHISALEDNLEGFIKAIDRLPLERPFFIWSYSSALTFYANQILEHGIKLKRYPRAIITGAEATTSVSMQTVEQAFHCRPHNHYGTMEMAHIAQDCPDNPSVMHVPSELSIVRIVDSKNRDVQPGQEGAVVITNLHNWAMPFINYDTGDRAVAGSICSCGRGFPIISALDGRTNDIIQLSNGQIISGTMINPIVRTAGEITKRFSEIQLIQTTINSLTLQVVPKNSFSNDDARALKTHFEEKLSSKLTITVECVDEIMRLKSGKRPLIIPLS